MLLRALLLLWLTIATAPAWALETFVNGRGERLVSFREEGRWIVNVYAADPEDGWPDLRSHREYASESRMRAAVERWTSGSAGLLENVSLRSGDRAKAESALPQNGVVLTSGHVKSKGKSKTKAVEEAGLWPIKHAWSSFWEDRYSAWIGRELTPDFFQAANLETTCSDVAYILRWIFAREHGLPAANRLTSGDLFTHLSVRPKWKSLPTGGPWYEDQRFLAAIRYLSRNTFTHTLWRDSYPVAMHPPALSTGAYHMNLQEDYGHTMIVHEIGTEPDQIPMLTLSSTTPRAVRLLNEYMYVEAQSDPERLGLLRMRWPVVGAKGRISLVEPEDMPYYSTEQFAPDFVRPPRTQFWQEIFFRLNPRLDYARVAGLLVRQLAKMFQDRVPMVEDGYWHCARGECPEGTQNWEDWSTPNRDARLASNIAVFEQVLGQADDLSRIDEALEAPTVAVEGRELTLGELIAIWKAGRFSSDPKNPVSARWGL